MSEEIDQLINSDLGKRYGFKSRADFVTKAVREYIDIVMPRFQHLNMVGDNVKIVDFQSNRVATLYFKEGGKVCCDLCESESCAHIDYALDQPDIQEELKKHDWTRK